MMNRFIAVSLLLVLLGMVCPMPVQADVFWTGSASNGEFNDPGNWDVFPVAGDVAHVGTTMPEAYLDADFTNNPLLDLYIGSNNVAVGTGKMTQAGHLLQVSGIFAVSQSDTTAESLYEMTGGTLDVTAGIGQIRVSSYGLGRMTVANSDAPATVNCNALFVPFVGTGAMVLNGNSDADPVVLNVASSFHVGLWGTGVLEINHATVTHDDNWLMVGDGGGGVGTVHMNSGTVTHLGTDTAVGLVVGNAAGIGVWNQNGGTTDLGAVGVWIGRALDGAGTLNLNGGTMVAIHVITDTIATSSTLNFNGGTLKASADSAAFIDSAGGVMQLMVQSGGAVIDSDTFSITIVEVLQEDSGSTGGGLTKLGSGSLALSGAQTYTGLTSVNEGTLKGTGSIAGDVDVASGATIEAGASIGTLTVNGGLDLDGTLLVEYDSSDETIDLLEVVGELVLTNGTFSFSDYGSETMDEGAYVFATYGTLTDTAAEEGLPPGWSVEYGYGGSNQIALVVSDELIPGDTDNNRIVDAVDAAVVASHWGAAADPDDYAFGNINDDTVVDAIDAAIQAAHWGDHTGGESAQGVPEPSTLVMIGSLLAFALWRRRVL